MQFVCEVLGDIDRELDRRIKVAELRAQRDSDILKFLQRCVCEQVAFRHTIANANKREELVGDNLNKYQQHLEFGAQDDVSLIADSKNAFDAEVNRSSKHMTYDDSIDRGDSVLESLAEISESSIPGSSLEDILRRAKQLRELNARPSSAKQPGSDGSHLGGRAGRTSASSHSSAHGLNVSCKASIMPNGAKTSKALNSHHLASKISSKVSSKSEPKLAISTNAQVKKSQRLGSKVSSRADASEIATVRAESKTVLKGQHRQVPVSSKERGHVSANRQTDAKPWQRKSNVSSSDRGADSEFPAFVAPQPSDAVWTQLLVTQIGMLLQPAARRYLTHMSAIGSTVEAARAAIPSVELIESQAMFLRQISGFAMLPPSVAYAFVCSQKSTTSTPDDDGLTPRKGSHVTNDANAEEEIVRLRSICATASNAFHAAHSEYNKHWRLRLERTAQLTALSPSEKGHLIAIWYRLRRSSDAYVAARQALHAQHQASQNAASNAAPVRVGVGEDPHGGKVGAYSEEEDKVKALALLRDLVINFPDYASDKQLCERQAHFAANVQYVAETAIGGFLLRDVVHHLRQCYTMSLDLDQGDESQSASDSLKKEWKEALLAYRSLHCCLLSGGADATSCMFMNK